MQVDSQNHIALRRGRGRPFVGAPPVTINCAVCGKERTMPAAWFRKVKNPTCSKQCNGVLRGKEWALHGYKGALARSSESYLAAAMKGARNPAWKGGVTYRKRHGNYVSVKYVRCPPEFASMARTDGYVMEHRLVMARLIGRPLLRVECVHHEDHKPLNNNPSNLELWPDNRSHKMAEHGRIAKGAANRLFLTD
jgi:endogenous inhibitor of DNA gyrase (YacG/DUF329 family)